MLINEKTALSSSRVLLVPYSKHHVPRYHEWMKDPEIQQATASEPLSLSEEYAMQTSWRTDADKLTFIVCLPVHDTLSQSPTSILTDPSIDAPAAMLGDVNMFLRVDEEDEGEDGGNGASDSIVVGEIELMIAEKAKQGRGFGRAALICFLKYISEHESEIVSGFVGSTLTTSSTGSVAGVGRSTGGKAQNLAYLSAKIGADNVRSLALFESVGFKTVSEGPNVFGEVELRRESLRGDEGRELLGKWEVEGYREIGYER
ncbi:hypothetical protein AJ79_02255 [Helicocarpus griseus UAMH5409]|uniref:N-acetyltransferase domain-containing protein n=1 Tax=Helicocarpus griseus UAMH5409 TaxID=1447875 RepID=A0A2B7Y3P2_9EURO|nr:hypothetical protein AJ79_02255 [Helicocarpus griseus UAMH5409]